MIRQPQEAAAVFDPQRLRLARELRGLKKKDVASKVGVTASAITQYELGQNRPGPAVVSRLALALSFPVGFFAAGRPLGEVGTAGAHFRSLRSTTVRDRNRALAVVNLLWEIAQVVERSVELPAFEPLVDLSHATPDDAARALRQAWAVPSGPIANMVRLMESRGVLVFQNAGLAATISAFSAPLSPRPVVVLDPRHDRARSRFDAAHELGHLALHPDPDPGVGHEEEANAFAAELLMPAEEIEPQLPRTASLHLYLQLKAHWGVSVQALLMRARQLGSISDASYRRGVQKLVAQYGRREEPVALGPAEDPVLMRRGLELLEAHGIGLERIADELCLSADMVRTYLGLESEAERLRVSREDVLVRHV